MGTRSLTIVRSRWNQEEEFRADAVIYRHYDSQPETHGRCLAEFLDGLELINGIPGNPPKKFANGPGRLAAQLVCHLQDVGCSPDLRCQVNPCGQEFEYYLDCDMETCKITLIVYDGPMTFFGAGGDNCTNQIFQGTVSEYAEWIEAAVAAE